jgi:PncC family amidohydrolase
MPNLIQKIHTFLLKSGKTISTAESCTGGLLSSMLTELSGSSKYFILGVVSYSNAAKTNILNISAGTIQKNGAVSKEVALLMAKNIRKIAKTDFGIGITGIAGPTGGSKDKPLGTVFIAISDKNKSVCKKFVFKGNRWSIQKQAASKALQLLRLI